MAAEFEHDGEAGAALDAARQPDRVDLAQFDAHDRRPIGSGPDDFQFVAVGHRPPHRLPDQGEGHVPDVVAPLPHDADLVAHTAHGLPHEPGRLPVGHERLIDDGPRERRPRHGSRRVGLGP
ncbi:hypothetical protein B4N89_05730 [Embleya scabrispora]|uniref:Uncharacterized protein n=1 Tax=Embleya scabrispora TaxID=159449 RepID=A0A1T3NUQ0_9ACTN|nr:hypothetical protein B4N89_05730 [Embleya scabrispora]